MSWISFYFVFFKRTYRFLWSLVPVDLSSTSKTFVYDFTKSPSFLKPYVRGSKSTCRSFHCEPKEATEIHSVSCASKTCLILSNGKLELF